MMGRIFTCIIIGMVASAGCRHDGENEMPTKRVAFIEKNVTEIIADSTHEVLVRTESVTYVAITDQGLLRFFFQAKSQYHSELVEDFQRKVFLKYALY